MAMVEFNFQIINRYAVPVYFHHCMVFTVN